MPPTREPPSGGWSRAAAHIRVRIAKVWTKCASRDSLGTVPHMGREFSAQGLHRVTRLRRRTPIGKADDVSHQVLSLFRRTASRMIAAMNRSSLLHLGHLGRNDARAS